MTKRLYKNTDYYFIQTPFLSDDGFRVMHHTADGKEHLVTTCDTRMEAEATMIKLQEKSK